MNTLRRERPSPLLSREIERIQRLVPGKRALDIACGEGRNSVFLAQHGFQVQALADGGADMISAITMTYPAQAVGIACAAKSRGLPHVLSFTVETDGHLPNGQPLQQALAETEAETGGSALFYMVNCAHPEHFARDLSGPMRSRIGGIRANASRLSHAELDESTTLDDGDPVEFGHFYAAFGRSLPNLRLVGGCCGSDHRHVGEACRHLHGGGGR